MSNDTITLPRAVVQAAPTEEAKRTLNNPPERIYMQVGDESSDWPGDIVWSEVTWSEDQVEDSDLVYVRADLVKAQPQAEPAKPLFANNVTQRKWDELQAKGYRMLYLTFGREDEVGQIGYFGDVSWDVPIPLGCEAQPATQQPAGEPVAWWDNVEEKLYWSDSIKPYAPNTWNHKCAAPEAWFALYTTPQPRKPLTDEQIDLLALDEDGLPNSHLEFARAIEAAHGIGSKT